MESAIVSRGPQQLDRQLDAPAVVAEPVGIVDHIAHGKQPQCKARRQRWWNRLRLLDRWGPAGVPQASASVDARLEAREAIEAALAALPAAQREVLVLHHLEGLSIPEVAEVLDVSENAVSTRLYRARRAMEAQP